MTNQSLYALMETRYQLPIARGRRTIHSVLADERVARLLKLDEMITHRFPFERYLDAYHAIEASHGEYLKVMIELD